LPPRKNHNGDESYSKEGMGRKKPRPIPFQGGKARQLEKNSGRIRIHDSEGGKKSLNRNTPLARKKHLGFGPNKASTRSKMDGKTNGQYWGLAKR